MAIEKRQVEIKVCDFCGREGAYDFCLGCGKHICFECCKNPIVGQEYRFSAHFSGGSQGFYCLDCDSKPADRLKAAYVTMAGLIAENKAFYDRWQKAHDDCSAEIERLFKMSPYAS
jgi:hypothetical protein